MSFHRDDAFSSPRPRGGASIGALEDLEPVGISAVMTLRLWATGSAKKVRDELVATLGPARGTEAFVAMADFFELCADHGRRALMHHGLRCACLGADEAWFAQLICAALEGQREDAMMMAGFLLRVDMAGPAAVLAERIGLSLAQMATAHPPAPYDNGADKRPRVLH